MAGRGAGELADENGSLPRSEAELLDVPPIWLMRQAGRYLPEYRATRAEAGDFLKLCYTPKLAAEVTAAADPALRASTRPSCSRISWWCRMRWGSRAVRRRRGAAARSDPVGTMGSRGSAWRVPRQSSRSSPRRWPGLRQDLPPETALIGFCGAPWTVATYMAQGQGSPDQAEARLWAYRDPKGFEALIELLVATSIDYLDRQVKAGADCLQIFDTWAGSLPDDEFDRWVVAPTRAIREGDPRPASRRPGDRLSARCRRDGGLVRVGNGRRRDRLRYGHAAVRDERGLRRGGRGHPGKPRSRCCWWRAASGSTSVWMKSWISCGARDSSSTWVMESCHKRRPEHVAQAGRACAAPGGDGAGSVRERASK